MHYIEWSEDVSIKLYNKLEIELTRLRNENLLYNFSNVQLVDFLMDIVKENINDSNDSLIYCLINN